MVACQNVVSRSPVNWSELLVMRATRCSSPRGNAMGTLIMKLLAMLLRQLPSEPERGSGSIRSGSGTGRTPDRAVEQLRHR